MDEIKYTIAEASERLGYISYRTLHYYESKFGLNIDRDDLGNRVYTDYDIELLEKIIELKKKGMTLDGINSLLQERGILKPQNENIVLVDEKVLEARKYLIDEISEEIKSLILQQINSEFQNLNDRIDKLIQENFELKQEILNLQRQSHDHFKYIDKKISDWRESINRPWYKKLLFKNDK